MLKGLYEKRNLLVEEMEGLVNKAKEEKRAFEDAESTRFDEIKGEIAKIDKTIKAVEESRDFEHKEEKRDESKEELEIRSFENYIKIQCGVAVESRAGEQNFTIANNGAVIPTSIANRVIKAVKERCSIFANATIYRVNGTLKIPVYGKANTTHDITVAYSNEFTELTADAGAFTSVDLTGYLVGALSLIGQSVINNSAINVTDFVINEMADKIALFLEKELINGTTSYATGALSTTTTMNAGSISAITADNLIDLQTLIPTAYQANARFVMAPATFKAIKKLKDSNGQYLLQPDFTKAFPYTILGKPVELSDNMPAIGSAAKAVLYGDYSGLAVNMREDVSIQVLREKYATQHAVGIVSWFEFDSKVIDNQKLATLVMSV